MKFVKAIWGKVIDIIDDIAAQLGLQHRPVPVRVKQDECRKKK